MLSFFFGDGGRGGTGGRKFVWCGRNIILAVWAISLSLRNYALVSPFLRTISENRCQNLNRVNRAYAWCNHFVCKITGKERRRRQLRTCRTVGFAAMLYLDFGSKMNVAGEMSVFYLSIISLSPFDSLFWLYLIISVLRRSAFRLVLGRCKTRAMEN